MMHIRDEDIRLHLEWFVTADRTWPSSETFVMSLKWEQTMQRLKRVLSLEQIEKCGAGNSSNKSDEFWLYRARGFSI